MGKKFRNDGVKIIFYSFNCFHLPWVVRKKENVDLRISFVDHSTTMTISSLGHVWKTLKRSSCRVKTKCCR